MKPLNCQIDLIGKIYNELMNHENIIHLKGNHGSGKTFIIKSIIYQLIEDWKIFYLPGISKYTSPYFTLQENLYNAESTTTKELHSNVSFGINFSPLLPIYCEGSFSIENNEILSALENTIYQDICRQIEGERNVLIVAEDIENWDEASVSFLHKILSLKGILFSQKNLHVLLSYSTTIKAIDELFPTGAVYHIPKISTEDIQIILRQLGVSVPDNFNWNIVSPLAENNIKLIALCCDYCHANDSALYNFPKLSMVLDEKLKKMGDKGIAIASVLNPASIIERKFTAQDISGINSFHSIENTTKLRQAQQEHFIDGSSYYKFVSEDFRLLFQKRILDEKESLHYKFAYYLKEFFPEDYYERAHHLILTQERNCYEEAAYLLCIELCRRLNMLDPKAIEGIEIDLQHVLSLLDQDYYIRHNIVHFKAAMSYFKLIKYDLALTELKKINYIYTSDAFSVEAHRLETICIKNISLDSDEIKKATDVLFEYIESESFMEDEQWCQSALILEAFFLDTLNDYARAQHLHNKLERIIKKHKNSKIFNTLHAIEERKAAMFYAAPMAMLYTEASLDFFKYCKDDFNTYLSSNNHATNCIRSFEYAHAEKCLKLCEKILNDNDNKDLLLGYKIKNNMLLLEFLKMESDTIINDITSHSRHVYSCQAKKTALQFHAELENAKDNDGKLILTFNYLSMLFISFYDNQKEITLLLEKLNCSLVDNYDAYYTYFLKNAFFAYHYLRKEFKKAKAVLNEIFAIKCPLFDLQKPIFRKRNDAMETLLENEKDLDSISYNHYFFDYMKNTGDASWRFWGRGFLLSDTDFWWL